MDRLKETEVTSLAGVWLYLSELPPTYYYKHLAEPGRGPRCQALRGLSVNSECRSGVDSGLEAEGVELWNKDTYFSLSLNPYPLKEEDFPSGSDSKEFTCNAGGLGSSPGLGRSPGEENRNPL